MQRPIITDRVDRLGVLPFAATTSQVTMHGNLRGCGGSYKTGGDRKSLLLTGRIIKRWMTAALVWRVHSWVWQEIPRAQISVFDLSGLDIKFCTGTIRCGKPAGTDRRVRYKGRLWRRSWEDMVACDVLVFRSPVLLFASHTALMQRFLERCLPLMQYSGLGPRPRNPVRKDKKGVVIVFHRRSVHHSILC
jgi:multimeric flavodoxin WrbA